MIRRSAPAFGAALLTVCLAVGELSAQDNPRFGRWRMASDAPPPSSNIMTYAPYGEGGMQVTVESVNARGDASAWGYVTMFDGAFRPVTGQQDSETAVDIVDERTTRISNARGGKVYQVIINTLSEDLNTIQNEYVRLVMSRLNST